MKKEVKKNLDTSLDSPDKGKVKISSRFITTLAIVSILGFIGIVSQTLFSFNMSHYIESFWMFIIGIGMMIEAKIGRLKTLSQGLTSNNFTHLTTIIIGVLAILAGIFSFPIIRIETPAFLAIKGIVSIIAIIVIVLQTWIVD